MVNRNECNTYVSTSEVDGYGTFAAKDIAAGEVLESFLVLPLPWREMDLDSRTSVLKRYSIVMPTRSKANDERFGRMYVIPAGNVIFYNHDSVPNAKILTGSDTKGRAEEDIMFNRVIALRDVAEGMELFLDYDTCYCKDWAEHWPQQRVEDPPE